jgi:hypothetical protein
MNSLEAFLPEPPKPATEAEIDATMRKFLIESFKAHPHYTKEQHIEYAAHGTAIYLNL